MHLAADQLTHEHGESNNRYIMRVKPNLCILRRTLSAHSLSWKHFSVVVNALKIRSFIYHLRCRLFAAAKYEFKSKMCLSHTFGYLAQIMLGFFQRMLFQNIGSD
jgi:hypothetical protein